MLKTIIFYFFKANKIATNFVMVTQKFLLRFESYIITLMWISSFLVVVYYCYIIYIYVIL